MATEVRARKQGKREALRTSQPKAVRHARRGAGPKQPEPRGRHPAWPVIAGCSQESCASARNIFSRNPKKSLRREARDLRARPEDEASPAPIRLPAAG